MSLLFFHGQTAAAPAPSKPIINSTTKITINIKNKTFAIPPAAEAIPPNPKAAAIKATIKKTNAHPNKPMVPSFNMKLVLIRDVRILISGSFYGFSTFLNIFAGASDSITSGQDA